MQDLPSQDARVAFDARISEIHPDAVIGIRLFPYDAPGPRSRLQVSFHPQGGRLSRMSGRYRILSRIGRHGPEYPISLKDYETLSPGDQAGLLVAEFEDQVGAESAAIEEIEEAISSLSHDVATRLGVYKLRCNAISDTGGKPCGTLVLQWTGWTDHLTIEEQMADIDLWDGITAARIRSSIEYRMQRDARLQGLSMTGVRIDYPLSRLAEDAGVAKADVIATAKVSSIMTVGGREVRTAFREGVLQSAFALDERITWSRGAISVKEMNLPDTMLRALSGEPVSRVLPHSLFQELVIRSARNTGRTLTLQTAERSR